MNASRASMFVYVVAGLLAGTVSAVNIETVPVGNPGNAADTHYPGCGSVSYSCRIGKYEVTAGQYCEFLNAVARNDTYGLYDPRMADPEPNSLGCNIQRSGTSGSYTYSVASDWANRPVNYVHWGDCARFCNWLTNGQRAGSQDSWTTEDGSYYLNGANDEDSLFAVVRKPDARYVLPTEDEWYKAAYYDPAKPGGAGYWDYPTRSDTPPSNVLDPNGTNNANYDYTLHAPYYRTEVGVFAHSGSAYGTFDQGGNVWEWNETPFTSLYKSRGMRGGSFISYVSSLSSSRRTRSYLTNKDLTSGFRIAYVPEPATLGLLALGGLAVMRRKRGNHVVGRLNHIGRRNMQTQAVSLLVVFSAATGGYAASFSRFTIALGGENHAAEWKQGQRMLFTPGTTEDGRVFHVGDVITWDVRLECGGIHEQPDHPADGYPVWGAANIVHCLEIRADSATGPLATSAGFFSSINDGTGGDPLAPAAFAASYSIGGNGPGRLIDRYSAGGPWLGFFMYPNATFQPGRLSTGGAGYGQWSPDGGPTHTTTPGVGMELLPNGAPGLGVVPITEGQIDTGNMPPGNYVLRVVPEHAPPAYSGNNGLRGDCDLSIERPAFAVYMNETFWDDISFTLIPEPGSLLLLALGGMVMMRRRWSRQGA